MNSPKHPPMKTCPHCNQRKSRTTPHFCLDPEILEIIRAMAEKVSELEARVDYLEERED